MLQEALGRGEGPYLSLLAEIQRRSKISQLLPAEPVKQQKLQTHPKPLPLITKAQLSVTQHGAESAASSSVSSDSQSDVQLDAAVSTLSAGELARTPHSTEPAGADSKLQLLQQETSSSCAEASTQARVDRKLNSNKRANTDNQHQQQQQQQQQQEEEEGMPGGSKRYIRPTSSEFSLSKVPLCIASMLLTRADAWILSDCFELKHSAVCYEPIHNSDLFSLCFAQKHRLDTVAYTAHWSNDSGVT